MRKQPILVAAATVAVGIGAALAENQAPQQYNKSAAPSGIQGTTPDHPPIVTLPEANAPAPDATGAPIPETTGQAPTFEDRWFPQGGLPYRPPNALLPNTTAPAPETTGQAASMSPKTSLDEE
jgi:hypothetical protein